MFSIFPADCEEEEAAFSDDFERRGKVWAIVVLDFSIGNGALKGASKDQFVSNPSFCQSPAMEIVFSITQEADGGFVGECLSHDIFTQGDTWDALRANVKEAVDAYFFDQPRPASIRLHLVRDEVLAVA